MIRRAFSILELLIVILIICVLAAILFPVFARAKDSSYKTSAISQAAQLGKGLLMYLDQNDNKYLPSTNYGLPNESPEKLWTNGLYGYLKDKRVFIAPGSEGKFAETWEERSFATLGYSSATAVDPVKGCSDKLKDSSGCLAFKTAADFDKGDSPSQIALLATTPGGELAKKYLGYEFSPYNGTPNPEKMKFSPPLTSDRDLVKELGEFQAAELIKPVLARYNATGHDDGETPLIFADGHAKMFSAKSIQGMLAGIVWRFR